MSNEQRSELEHLIHDARKPLNQISMQAELVKLMAAEPASNVKYKKPRTRLLLPAKAVVLYYKPSWSKEKMSEQ